MGLQHTLATFAGKLMRPLRAGDEKLAEADQPSFIASLGVTSDAFADGARMPAKYSSTEGSSVSPPLRWSGVPAEAKALVLLCEDPDAPMPKPFVHWLVNGIAPATGELSEGAGAPGSRPGGAAQGPNSKKEEAYVGPAPPPGHGPHHYHFQLFALDEALTLAPGADRDAVVAAMDGHVLAAGEVVGVYERT